MKNLTKAAAMGTALLLLSKILGFLREIFLAYKFGTSYIVDAYTAAIALPSVLFAVYAFGFSESFIPVYMRIPEERARKDFFSNVLTILLLGSLVIIALCCFFSGQLAAILAPGFDGQAQALLERFIRILSVIFPVMTANSLLSAQLQALEEFTIVQFCEFIVVNILVICSILLATEDAAYILVAGYILAYVAAVTLLWLYASRRKGLSFRPKARFRDPYFTALCALALPLGASRLVSQLNGVMDRVFASLLGEGVTSALNYAHKVEVIFYTLTTSVFLSVCYPRINRHFAEGDREGGMYYIKRAVLVSVYVSLPVMGGLLLFSEPLVALLFERGMFSAGSTAMTAGCLAFYGLGTPFYALREVGSQTLAANTAQKRILKNTAIAVACNILLNALLLRPLGHAGLALATSLTGAITAALIFLDLRKLDLRVFERAMLPDLAKIAASAALSLLLCGVCFGALKGPLGEGAAIILGACSAVAAYLVLSIVLRIGIFVWIYRRLPVRVRVISFLNHEDAPPPD